MILNDNILSLIDNTPDAIMKSIALRVKQKRLDKNFTQQALALRAGLSTSSYRRFERSGEIALRSLVMIAIALDMNEDFSNIFTSKTYQSIEDVTQDKQVKKRKRGSINE